MKTLNYKGLQQMTAVTAPTINAQYAMDEEGGLNLPWLQASHYQPRTTKEKIHLVAPGNSLERLSDEALEGVETEEVDTLLGKEEGTATVLKNARWVILTKPSSSFISHKKEGHVVRNHKSLKFSDGWQSISRVFLACVVDGKVMLNDDGEVQVWTLKLKGLKTQWINGKGLKSIVDLNKGLKKFYDVKKGWVTHLASVALSVYAKEFQGAEDSSLGAMFGFADGDNAQPLSEENQKLLFDLVNTEDFKALAADPFYVGDGSDSTAADNFEVEEEDEVVVPSMAGIDF